MTGDVPPPVLFHCVAIDGLPLPSNRILKPEIPPPLAMKNHVDPSAGLLHTAGCESTTPPCGSASCAPTLPPVAPGAPVPLRLARLSRRSCESLPACTARCGTAEDAGTGSTAGAVLPTSASALSRLWKFGGVYE